MSSSPDVTAIQRLRGILVRLHKSFHDVWSCVYETLCNDAPEGFVPEELEEEDIGTKDVLSYSWRALKESRLANHIGLSDQNTNNLVCFFVPSSRVAHSFCKISRSSHSINFELWATSRLPNSRSYGIEVPFRLYLRHS